jgi:pre-mRNA-processing factor 6
MLGVNVKTPQTNFSKPPPGYIPGVGRGAVGFMTRSDIGPAGANQELGGAGRGRGAGAAAKKPPTGAAAGATAAGAAAAAADTNDGNFDAFAGYQERLFSDAPYEEDDAEADRIYAQVDDEMEARTAKRRQQSEADLSHQSSLSESRIADQFADLKRQLAGVTAEQWEAIPDIGDRTIKKKKQDSFTPVPDSILQMNRPDAKLVSGSASVGAGSETTLTGLSETRNQMLGLKLDKMSDSVSGQTVVDPKGYLTSLSSQTTISSESDIADVKKARLLLKSVVTTNPKHGPGWIAAARLEEQRRDMAAARRLIREGCEHCADDEDVWLEAARLQTPAQARVVLADAVRHLPHSVRLWMAASELEGPADAEARKAVLRKALTLIPHSEKLWKAAVALETPEDARIMLARAVECVPSSPDLWLALAKLETYESAQRVLNQARQAVPAEPSIWVAAAKLEEARGKPEMVARIIPRAIKALSAQQVSTSREVWLKYAEDAEAAAAPLTAAAIARSTADLGVEDVDRRRTWTADAQAFEEHGAIACARALTECLLTAFPDKEAVWTSAAEFERRHGTKSTLDALLRTAVSRCPQSEVLWLMAAKEKWLAGDVEAARVLLRESYSANPGSEQIWLAAVKIEWESDEPARARALLERARSQAPTARVWMKSALLEREAGALAAEESLLIEGTSRYAGAPKLWMMLAQLYERTGKAERAREVLQAGIKACSTSVPLWRIAVLLEERLVGSARARSLLEAARHRVPKCPELWLESVRLERRAGNAKLAETTMAKALQECPASGLLLAEDIAMAPRAEKKRKCGDAVKKADADPRVVAAVAKLFWADRKYEKARKWFERAVTLDSDLGDAWAAYFAFELQNGTPETQRALEQRCVASEPAHGDHWQAVAKRPENRRLTRAEILKRVVVHMAVAGDDADRALFGAHSGVAHPGVAIAPGPDGSSAAASAAPEGSESQSSGGSNVYAAADTAGAGVKRKRWV